RPCSRPAAITVSQRATPNSAWAYSSQPSSPTYVTRSARTGTRPSVIGRLVRYGNAPFDRSSVDSGVRMSRARGPHSPKQTGREGFRGDGRAPVLARPAPRAERVQRGTSTEARVVGVRLEPVRPLPTGLLPERGSEGAEAVVRRRHAERPAGLALLVRVVDVVVGRVDLRRPGEGPLARPPVLAGEAADVHVPQVELWLPVDDPAGDLSPASTCASDPVGTEAGGDEEAPDLALAEDE